MSDVPTELTVGMWVKMKNARDRLGIRRIAEIRKNRWGTEVLFEHYQPGIRAWGKAREGRTGTVVSRAPYCSIAQQRNIVAIYEVITAAWPGDSSIPAYEIVRKIPVIVDNEGKITVKTKKAKS